jgi:hypothetical protein
MGTKAGRSKLFYARIQDLGRKAQTVTVRRFRAAGSVSISAARSSGRMSRPIR